jgi:general secretion pathway protein I
LSGHRHRGFTLIEVLVALVIVAVGMSVLMGALSSSARSVVYMQDKTFAEWVALNQIALLRLGLQQGQVPPAGTTNGDLDFGNRSWHWRQDVVVSQVPGINLINFKVRPKEIKGGDDDSWYVTVTGLAGNGMAAPGTSTAQVNWDPDLTGAGQQGGAGGGNNPTNLPPASKTPPPTPPPGTNQ